MQHAGTDPAGGHGGTWPPSWPTKKKQKKTLFFFFFNLPCLIRTFLYCLKLFHSRFTTKSLFKGVLSKFWTNVKLISPNHNVRGYDNDISRQMYRTQRAYYHLWNEHQRTDMLFSAFSKVIMICRSLRCYGDCNDDMCSDTILKPFWMNSLDSDKHLV